MIARIRWLDRPHDTVGSLVICREWGGPQLVVATVRRKRGVLKLYGGMSCEPLNSQMYVAAYAEGVRHGIRRFVWERRNTGFKRMKRHARPSLLRINYQEY